MPSMEVELTRDSVLKQVGPCFSEMDARAFVKLEPEAAIFAIMTLAKRVAELTGLVAKADPSAPSGQTATFLKPEELFTFLDHDEVPSDNNGGERGIRPAVLIRKNSYGNGSERGAQTQAVMMTIMRTLKMREHNPVQICVDALKSYVRSGKLPPLPTKITANG